MIEYNPPQSIGVLPILDCQIAVNPEMLPALGQNPDANTPPPPNK